MRHILIILMVSTFLFNISCNNSKQESNNSDVNGHEVTVKEVLQASSYTYLLCDENGTEKWLAAPKMVAQVGAKYFYDGALEMVNFESKDLNRVFDKVYFVEKVTTNQEAKTKLSSPHMDNPHEGGRKMIPKSNDIKLEPKEGAIALNQLFEHKKEYKNKEVKVYGIVVKVNKEIMNRDWIHIQDGSGGENNYDLTITSVNSQVNVGDTVFCSGKLMLEKDFGHGYAYDIILEEGKFTSK